MVLFAPFLLSGRMPRASSCTQRDGYMCAEVVNPDRPKWTDPGHATPEEKLGAADGTLLTVADMRST